MCPVAATGNLGDTIEAHIALCRRVADAGADVVMLVVPEFYDNDADLERYFLTIADAVDAPLGLYECPVPRAYHLGIALVEKLARTGRFVAFKETSEDLAKIVALLRATQGTPLALLQANTPYLLDATRAGTPGTMSIAAAWLPDLVAAVIEAGCAGDPDAERLQAELCAMEMVQRVVHPQGTKYLLGKRGVPITPASRTSALAADGQCGARAGILRRYVVLRGGRVGLYEDVVIPERAGDDRKLLGRRPHPHLEQPQ